MSRSLVPLLQAKDTPCTAEEADMLRAEVLRLYKLSSDLRLQMQGERETYATIINGMAADVDRMRERLGMGEE